MSSRTPGLRVPSSVHLEPAQWVGFEACNHLDPRGRVLALAALGVHPGSRQALEALGAYHFVIPDRTRWRCLGCVACCQHAPAAGEIDGDPLPCQGEAGLEPRRARSPLRHPRFPFRVIADPTHGPLLTIDPTCPGLGTGALVDYRAVLDRLHGLARAPREERPDPRVARLRTPSPRSTRADPGSHEPADLVASR